MFDWLRATIDWLNHNGNALSAFAAIVTAVVAAWALIAAVRDSHERSRPVVVAEFRQAPHNDEAFDLVIRNAGQSVARAVRVTFSPELVRPTEENIRENIIERYADPIPVLAPGQELTNVWWSGMFKQGEPELVNWLETPDEVTIHVTYTGLPRRSFTDEFVLKTQTMLHTTRSTSSSSFKGRAKSADLAVNALSKSVARIAATLETLARSDSAGPPPSP